MRPLTKEESVRSREARKRAKHELKKHDPVDRGVGGLPVVLKSGDLDIVIDYDLVRQLLRTLKPRRYEMRIVQLSDWERALVIDHYEVGLGNGRGAADFYELPSYQRELLTDLPIVEI